MNIIIPSDKKYLLFIKTAKTGGTSFSDFLKQIKPIKIYKRINNQRILENVKENDIIMIVNDNLSSFKKNYKKIFNNSYKILISRDPYEKINSCYHYHPCCINNSLVSLLKNKENLKYNSTKIDYKLEAPRNLWNYYSLFTHFYLPQTYNLIENDELIIDKVIRFENMNEDIDKLFQKINIDTTKLILKHLNKTENKKKLNLNNEEINLINERFSNDFKYLNYNKL